MSFIAYYAACSFKNQFKKLFKSWVIAFIVVCALIGGLIGFGASVLSSIGEAPAPEPEAPAYEDVQPDGGEGGEFLGEETPERLPDPAMAAGITELAVGGLCAFMLGISLLAYNGNGMFLPADVNILFASPLTPQTVLLFRVLMQVGLIIYSTAVMMFQIPNLRLNAGLSWRTVGALLLAWFLVLIFSKFAELAVYLASSANEGIRKHMRTALTAFFAALFAAYALYMKASGLSPLEAAFAFFNAPASRYIPVWGWIKGLVVFASEGKFAAAALCVAACAVFAVLCAWLIWRMKPSYYEDAMGRSEVLAEALRNVKDKGKLFGRVSGKKFADDLPRDGMNRGGGGSVFFWKAVMNRRRFSRAMLITKTSLTYMAAAAAVTAFEAIVLGEGDPMHALAAIAVLAFYRTLGDPFAEDGAVSLTATIPVSASSKLFYSLLGGVYGCLLDIIPACVLLFAYYRSGLTSIIACALFILTVDVYGSVTGSFIARSSPANAGDSLKQIVQMLFLYFGLLPDAAAIAFGAVTGRLAEGLLAAAGINLLIASVFFAACVSVSEPKSGRPPRAKKPAAEGEVREGTADAAVGSGEEGTVCSHAADLRGARRAFSRIGFSLVLIMALASLAQIFTASVLGASFPGFQDVSSWMYWVGNFAPLYLIAVPAGLALLAKLPKEAPVSGGEELGFFRWLRLVPIGFFLMYLGSGIGMLLTLGLSALLPSLEMPGGTDFNPILNMVTDSPLLARLLVMVVLAPIMEEFVFRRQLIDRIKRYGERTAVICSSLMFGLFHGNLQQFCYASLLGLLLGTVYIKTGKLRYSIGLHMVVNLVGSVVAPAAALTEETLAGQTTPAAIAFGAFVVVMFFAGLSQLILIRKRVRFSPAPEELAPGSLRVCWLNPGMLIFTALCAVSMAAVLLL